MAIDEDLGQGGTGDRGVPPDLSHAGAVVDKAIEYMLGQNLNPLSVASALLGGALGLLAREMDDHAVVQVLNNAIASVQAGELRHAVSDAPAEGPPRGRA